MPALAIARSIGPSSFAASATAAFTFSKSRTSHSTSWATPPLRRISSPTLASRSTRRASRATLVPSAASCRASSTPIPVDAPVTTATAYLGMTG
jgi:hypothetical protein